MGLKEIYLQAEDKWYGVLDKIDAHVPIYRVIDRIDKVVPSFPLFIALVAALVLLFIVLPVVLGPKVMVTLTVEDSEGVSLQGVEVSYVVNGVVNSAVSDQAGRVVFYAAPESEARIRIQECVLGGVEFEGIERTIFVGKTDVFETIVLSEKAPDFVDRTIVFQNSSGERLAGQAIRVRLSCQNPLVTPSPLEVVDSDMDGSIVVREPKDCGVFQATVIEPEEFKQKSYIISQGIQTVMLENRELPKGSIRVRIKDSGGSLVVSTNFDVKLLDGDGVKAGEKYSQNYGEAIFSNVTAGDYIVSVEDPSGQYSIASQAGISVSENETTVADIVVSKTVKATLKVTVKDKGTKQGIKNATVRIVNSEMKAVAEKSTGEQAEELVFRLTDTGDYTLVAMHADYLYRVVELSGVSDQDIAIELEKITAENSGRISVRVIDEDGLAVKNARVKIRFLGTGMIVPVSLQFTDRNGMAEFAGISEGSYYAYAEKYPSFGDNKAEGRQINIRETTRFTVRLLIGNSLVQVRAEDEDGLAVPETEAEFFSEQGESLGIIPLPEGTGKFELKADKRVYVVVKHPDYMQVQTMPRQLWPDKTIGFVAVLEPRLITGGPKIRFEGIFDMAGNRVQEIKASQKYVVQFRLSVPESADYRQGGFHFRVGNERLLANDPIVVRDVIAGNINAPLKGTSFSPPTGYGEDALNLTEGDAKWVNMSWRGMEPGNHYFGFEVRVKSQITPYTVIPMHYRAWAVERNGDYVRVPEDEALGLAESVAEKQGLYAKTFDLEFLEGSPSDCQEDFCYSGESILDLDQGLYTYEPYEMRSGARHKLTFDILNNSDRQYESSELYITITGLTVTGYKVQNASAQEIKAENVSVRKIEGVDLGEFTKGKSIGAEIDFTPGAPGNASVEVKVVADGRVVFLRNIAGAVLSDKGMRIEVSPEVIAAYVENRLEVKVLEDFEGADLEIGGALVRVAVTNPDRTEAFYSGLTSALGTVAFDLPAYDPNTRVEIAAEKPGYYAQPVIKIVDGNVLRFNPDSVNSSLDTGKQREQVFDIVVENLIGIGARIKSVSLYGKFYGRLDETKMINFARQQVGNTIAAGESEIIPFFMVSLSPNAEKLISGSEKLSGEFHITAESPEKGVEWDFVIPLKASIVIGGLPDNAPCISISRKEWTAVTQGNRATVEFEVRNNCMAGPDFVPLQNLQAKVNWKGDDLGIVELSITEAGTGASTSSLLRPVTWAPLFDDVQEESIYYAILTFTPKAGSAGKTAEFSVLIDGQVLTETGLEFVGSTPSQINAAIGITNLETCLQYPDAENVVELAPGQDSATFQIDASQCQGLSPEIYLCYGDSGCRGGASEGGIGVVPNRFTLTPTQPVKEVRVERQSIPGMYGVTVFARMPGGSYSQVHLVDVLVKPEETKSFYLDKYAFTTIGDNQDGTTLHNSLVQETVQVKANLCDWDESVNDASWLTGMLLGASVGFAAGGPVGALIGAITGLILGLILGEDCEDSDMTNPLPDFVIKLADVTATEGGPGYASDAGPVSLDNAKLGAAWSFEESGYDADDAEIAGLVFSNKGIQDPKPTYSVLAVHATEHVRGDETHSGNAAVTCRGLFSPYGLCKRGEGTGNCRPCTEKDHVEKFHLKFETAIVTQDVPLISYGATACVQGTLIGATGEKALPRTKLSWSWNDGTGISADACDEGNPDYVYCDATQFSIELSKKLHSLDGFMQANESSFACPPNPAGGLVQGFPDERTVENGRVGLRTASGKRTGDRLTVEFEAMNDTAASQTVDVNVRVIGPDDTGFGERSCLKTFSVGAQLTGKGSCAFEGLEISDKYYAITVDINSGTTVFVDRERLAASFRVTTEPGGCWLDSSTSPEAGKPVIEYFIENSANVAWTSDIPNLEALRKLLRFKAFLAKDGYSEDFAQDFAEFYTANSAYDAPPWFGANPERKMASFFEDSEHLDFRMRYVDSDMLPNAGLCDVALNIDFIGGDWDLFDAEGMPNAKVTVEFHWLKAPYPDSAFYYLPFNGNVGIGSDNGRQGYGISYGNAAEQIVVVGGGEFVKTQEIPGSNPAMVVNTDRVQDFRQINASASNRGFLLNVEEAGGGKRLLFSPNYATPVILKMSRSEGDQAFSAFYELHESGTPVETGGNLTFWEGMGACLDYSGLPVSEAFDYSADREANDRDNIQNTLFAYAVDWASAKRSGAVYLKSVFYAPVDSLYSLKAIAPGELRFITPNSSAMQSVELNGIQGMAFNSATGHNAVGSLKDVFDLVSAGKVCVTNSGARTGFWWNPKTLYETRGKSTSVKALEDSLKAGQSCIGAS